MIKLKYVVDSEGNTELYRNGKLFLSEETDREYIKVSNNNRLGQTLAHDSLEHFSNEQNSNLNELKALGALYAHRDYDFYNNYTGHYFLPDEIMQQLVNLYYYGIIPEIKSNPKNSVTNELIDEL